MKALPVLFLCALAGRAAGYPTADQFGADPLIKDGAGNVAFTGAPRWAGHTCDVCHTDPPRRIHIRLEADPVDLFTSGYKAGTTYPMRVVLLDEWAGLAGQAAGDNCGDPNQTPYQPCNDNGVALEIDDQTGRPVGTFAPANHDGTCGGTPPPDPDMKALSDGTAVVHSGFHHAQSAWGFCWTAPPAGAGPLTAYIAAVDGNGGDGTMSYPNDTAGDDVAAGAVPLNESGSAAMPPQHGACQAAPGGRGPFTSTLLLILAALLALGAAGCATVKPWERELLAKRKMKFNPDDAEAELDLHMQDAREGSSGGYGSAGGGCGCN